MFQQKRLSTTPPCEHTDGEGSRNIEYPSGKCFSVHCCAQVVIFAFVVVQQVAYMILWISYFDLFLFGYVISSFRYKFNKTYQTVLCCKTKSFVLLFSQFFLIKRKEHKLTLLKSKSYWTSCLTIFIDHKPSV